MSLQIMGLATIDPHSQKEHTEIHKIPMFGFNQARFDRDTAIQKRPGNEVAKKCMAIWTVSGRTASRWPYISL